MEQKTNYGKIIAITLSVIAAASAIAFVLYRLLRNLIEFCTVYDDPDEVEDCLDFDEMDENADAEEEILIDATEDEDVPADAAPEN
ncbi:MAG: hypothetical protein IJW51_00270 [Clostridia bacterium]|nr:hypothetical protein [Clostridia bacterium]